MRILFLGKRHYTNKDALRERFGRIYKLPLHWQRSGVTVELALFDYRGIRSETRDDGGLAITSLPILDPRTPARLNAIAGRIRPDVVVASGDCFVGLAGLRLSHSHAARLVFDVYDDYRTFGGYGLFLGWDAFGFLCRRADVVWYASRTLAPQQRQQRIVPNGVDMSQFTAGNMEKARRAVALDPNARWIGYFGSREPDRGTDDLVAAVGLLHERNPAVRLVLCGGGGQCYRQPWVDDRGNVPHSAIHDFINACDAVVLPYRRGPTIDRASSVKMAEYLFCERPIVATRTPSLMDNFPRQAAELGPAVADPGNVQDLARALDFQLREQLIASVPHDQTWKAIAAGALDSLAELSLR